MCISGVLTSIQRNVCGCDLSLYSWTFKKKWQFPDLFFRCVCVQHLKEALVLMHLKEFSSWWSYKYLHFLWTIWTIGTLMIQLSVSQSLPLSILPSYYPLASAMLTVVFVLTWIPYNINWKILSFDFHSLQVNYELNQMRLLWPNTK